MAVNSRNALFILCVFFTHIVVSYSAEEVTNRKDCPVMFCNDMFISFPFKIKTEHRSKCGLYTVDCSNSSSPKIQLKEGGYWYQLESISRSNFISINDSSLQERIKLLEKENCNDEVFDQLSLPSSPSSFFHISTTNNQTLFRCNNAQPNKTPNYFCRSSRFTYYTSSQNTLACSIIHIPIREGFPFDFNSHALTAEYSIQVLVTEECNQCFRKEGECQDDNGEFKCAILAPKGKCMEIYGHKLGCFPHEHHLRACCLTVSCRSPIPFLQEYKS